MIYQLSYILQQLEISVRYFHNHLLNQQLYFLNILQSHHIVDSWTVRIDILNPIFNKHRYRKHQLSLFHFFKWLLLKLILVHNQQLQVLKIETLIAFTLLVIELYFINELDISSSNDHVFIVVLQFDLTIQLPILLLKHQKHIIHFNNKRSSCIDSLTNRVDPFLRHKLLVRLHQNI